MAIRFNCDCGQTITARDEFAGRKVQCVGCKKVHVVPGQKAASAPAPKPPPIPRPAELPATLEPRPAAPPFSQPPEPAFEETAPLLARPPEEDLLLRASAPVPRPLPASAPTRSAMLHFRCACGSEYQAKLEYAGEPTRCARCGEILFIPSRGMAARADGRPVKAAFDRDDRYKPSREPGSSIVGVLAVLLILLLMGGGVFAYWEFYLKDYKPPQPAKPPAGNAVVPRMGQPPPGGLGEIQGPFQQAGALGGPPVGGMRGGQGGGRPGVGMGGGRPGVGMGGGQGGGRPGAGRPAPEKVEIVRDGENEKTQAFDLIPGDALGFLCHRWADTLNHPDNRKLMAQAGKEASAGLEILEQNLGMKMTDIERIIAVLPDASIDNVWAVVESSRPFPREKLLALAGASKPVMHGGSTKRAYYPAGPGGKAALHFVNDRLLVGGTKTGVEAYLSQGQRKSGPLDDMLKQAAGKRLFVGGLAPTPAVTQALTAKLPDEFAPFKQALGFKRLLIASEEGSVTNMAYEAEYADDKESEAVRVTLEAQFAAFRQQLSKLPFPAEVKAVLTYMMDGTKISRNKEIVRAEMKADIDKLGTLLKAIQKLQGAGGNPVPDQQP